MCVTIKSEREGLRAAGMTRDCLINDTSYPDMMWDKQRFNLSRNSEGRRGELSFENYRNEKYFILINSNPSSLRHNKFNSSFLWDNNASSFALSQGEQLAMNLQFFETCQTKKWFGSWSLRWRLKYCLSNNVLRDFLTNSESACSKHRRKCFSQQTDH